VLGVHWVFTENTAGFQHSFFEFSIIQHQTTRTEILEIHYWLHVSNCTNYARALKDILIAIRTLYSRFCIGAATEMYWWWLGVTNYNSYTTEHILWQLLTNVVNFCTVLIHDSLKLNVVVVLNKGGTNSFKNTTFCRKYEGISDVHVTAKQRQNRQENASGRPFLLCTCEELLNG